MRYVVAWSSIIVLIGISCPYQANGFDHVYGKFKELQVIIGKEVMENKSYGKQKPVFNLDVVGTVKNASVAKSEADFGAFSDMLYNDKEAEVEVAEAAADKKFIPKSNDVIKNTKDTKKGIIDESNTLAADINKRSKRSVFDDFNRQGKGSTTGTGSSRGSSSGKRKQDKTSKKKGLPILGHETPDELESIITNQLLLNQANSDGSGGSMMGGNKVGLLDILGGGENGNPFGGGDDESFYYIEEDDDRFPEQIRNPNDSFTFKYKEREYVVYFDDNDNPIGTAPKPTENKQQQQQTVKQQPAKKINNKKPQPIDLLKPIDAKPSAIYEESQKLWSHDLNSEIPPELFLTELNKKPKKSKKVKSQKGQKGKGKVGGFDDFSASKFHTPQFENFY